MYGVELKAGRFSISVGQVRSRVTGRGVGQCGTSHCHNTTCLNGGACLDHGATFTLVFQETINDLQLLKLQHFNMYQNTNIYCLFIMAILLEISVIVHSVSVYFNCVSVVFMCDGRVDFKPRTARYMQDLNDTV